MKRWSRRSLSSRSRTKDTTGPTSTRSLDPEGQRPATGAFDVNPLVFRGHLTTESEIGRDQGACGSGLEDRASDLDVVAVTLLREVDGVVQTG